MPNNQRIRQFFINLLPGLFLIGFNIGTGSVTAMAKAGANYGMALLWTIALSCLITYYMIVFFSRYTMVTGETALYAMRKHLHPAVGWFFLIALTINVSGGIMGVMGIVSEVLYEWSLTLFDPGVSMTVFAIACVGMIYALFFVGTTSFFEKALALMVAFMGLCFIINFFVLMPPLKEVLHGFVPSMPSGTSATGGRFLVTASMVGTTVSSMIFIVRTTLVKEQGWTMKDYSIQKRDAAVSAGLMFVISASIMAAAAGTLYQAGISLDHASDMVKLLEPIAGSAAVTIFVVGIVAAGLSSQFPNILLLPWLICDYFQIDRDMKQWQFRLLVLVMSLMGIVVPVFGGRPVLVMIASQALAAFVLPVTVISIFLLLNKKKLLGQYVNKSRDNVILACILLFSLVMCGFSIKGFWEQWM